MNGVADLETTGLINSSDHQHPVSSSFLGSMSNSTVMDEAFKTVSDLCQDNKLLKDTVQENNVFMIKQCEIIKTLREEREKEKQEIKEKAEQAKTVITTLSETVDLKNKTIEDLSTKLRDYQERPRKQSNQDSLRSDRCYSSTERSLVSDAVVENLQQQLEAEKEKVRKVESEKNDLLALNSDLNLQLHTVKKRDTADGEGNNGFVMLPTPENETPLERVTMVTAEAEMKDGAGDTGQQNSISDLLKELRQEQAKATKSQGLLARRQNEIIELARQLKQTKDDLQTANVNSEKQETILKGNIISLVAELNDRESKQLTAEKELQTLKDRCATIEVQLTRYRDQVSKDETQLKRNDYDLATSREENRRITEHQQHWRAECDKAFVEIGRLREELEKRETARKACSLERHTEIRNLNMRCMDMQRTLAETAEENRRLVGNMEQLQSTVDVLQCQADVYKDDFEDERRSKEKLHEDRERLVEEKKAVVKDKQRIEEQMRTLQAKNAQLADEVHVLSGENDMLQEKLAAHNQESIMTLQQRHGTLPGPGPRGGAYWQTPQDPNRTGGNPLPGDNDGQQNRGFHAHQEAQALDPLDEDPVLDLKCPLCQLQLPDQDSLNLHCDECIT